MGRESPSESSAESGSLDVVVDMVLSNGFFNNLLDRKGSVARGVKVSRHGVKGSVSGSPLVDFSDLSWWDNTLA